MSDATKTHEDMARECAEEVFRFKWDVMTGKRHVVGPEEWKREAASLILSTIRKAVEGERERNAKAVAEHEPEFECNDIAHDDRHCPTCAAVQEGIDLALDSAASLIRNPTP